MELSVASGLNGGVIAIVTASGHLDGTATAPRSTTTKLIVNATGCSHMAILIVDHWKWSLMMANAARQWMKKPT